LPALGAGIGKAIRNFKDAASGKGDEARPPADAKAGGPPGRGA
jgi:Sec-independent protein translocase protein TatA